MHEVVATATGLRTGRRISHVFVMDVPTYPRPLFITDAAVNIEPDLRGQASTSCRTPSTWRGSSASRAAGRDPLGGGDGELRRSPRRSTPPPSARWPTAGRSPAASSTGRSRSTTRSRWRRRGQGHRLARGRAGRHPGGARSRVRQHARQAARIPRRARSGAGIVLGARVPIVLTRRADAARDSRPPRSSRSCAGRARLFAAGEDRSIARPSASSSSTRGRRPSSSRCSGRRAIAGARAALAGEVDGLGAQPALRRPRRRRRTLAEPSGWRRARPRRRAAHPRRIEARHGDGPRAARRRATAWCTAASVTRARSGSRRRSLRELETLVPLAPLHQPHNLVPIQRAREASSGAAAGRVLRHRLPPPSPRSRRRSRCRGRSPRPGVRRYGFHGLSYEYIASVLPRHLADAARTAASSSRTWATAPRCARCAAGRSVATTMGFTAARRAADGHAHRRDRPRRDAPPAWTSAACTSRDVERAALQEVGTARACRACSRTCATLLASDSPRAA